MGCLPMDLRNRSEFKNLHLSWVLASALLARAPFPAFDMRITHYGSALHMIHQSTAWRHYSLQLTEKLLKMSTIISTILTID